MTININTSQKLIFVQYLNIINPLFGTNKLSNSEIEVLGRILSIDYAYKQYPADIRNKIIFSSEARNRMMRDISESNSTFSKQVFNNTIMSLKKKGVITGHKGNSQLVLNNPFISDVKNKTLTVTFNLHGEDLV